MDALLPAETIERKIFLIRGLKVMLDSDLAELYEVETRVLNQAVKRNIERFPQDFMFRLTKPEARRISQFVTSSARYERIKFSKRVTAFTENGVAMLSSVLNSPRAIQVNIQIMRTFTKLRTMISAHKELARKLVELEKKYDTQFKMVFDAIRELMDPATPNPDRIGFRVKEGRVRYSERWSRGEKTPTPCRTLRP